MSATVSKQDVARKIRIIIADDHPAFRQGLGQLLAGESDLEVVAAVGDGEEAVKAAKELSPDVVIMDITMPRLNGIEATKLIKEACPNTAVIILSAYGYEPYVLAAIKAGAASYFMKSAHVPALIGAVRAVHSGETVLDSTAARKLFDRIASNSGETSIKGVLHRRELEVLSLGARGLSNKEIASKLVISERTVQTHFLNISRKLGVNSRTEAVLRAVREGWITLEDLP